jgi:hypothetical protein
LHKAIVMSDAYRQATTFDAARAAVDPENRLLWRRRPLRIESEILRDSILQVSGTLNPERYGPAFKPPIPPEAMLARNVQEPYPHNLADTPETRRRSVYMFHKRVVQHPLMQAFDGPDAAVSCARRSITTVAPQALALLNDRFVRDRSKDFARRVRSETDGTAAAIVDRGFALALSRPPRESERAASIAFLENQSASRWSREGGEAPADAALHDDAVADFCQTLFGLNEFMYVD